MFLGEYQHNIDIKGRIIIPAKFRDALGENFIVTKGLDGCLFVYPFDEWQKLQQELEKLPLTQKDARAFVRFFFASASKGELDKQGRLMIPSKLRDYAGLNKEVMVIGVSKRLEIWDVERWQNYNDDEASFEQLAELMGQSGLGI